MQNLTQGLEVRAAEGEHVPEPGEDGLALWRGVVVSLAGEGVLAFGGIIGRTSGRQVQSARKSRP